MPVSTDASEGQVTFELAPDFQPAVDESDHLADLAASLVDHPLIWHELKGFAAPRVMNKAKFAAYVAFQIEKALPFGAGKVKVDNTKGLHVRLVPADEQDAGPRCRSRPPGRRQSTAATEQPPATARETEAHRV